ncbi:MAG: peptidase [Candidatus Parcubacteria bacterium]|nr:MAG: peptidase [Candidatus Parcubacteria bacterium]
MYNILIFGDSIAAGRKVEKIKSWPSLLIQQFDKKDKDFTLTHNLSISGESTNEVIKRLPIEAEARCRKIYPDDHSSIIFAVGINDTKCVESIDNPITNAEGFKNNIRLLIKNASKYTNHIIFVGLTPVDERKTTPLDNVYFLNEKIVTYEKIIGDECKKKNIAFLSIAEEWLRSDYLGLLSEDGIHPNEIGHRKIFEKIKPLFI